MDFKVFLSSDALVDLERIVAYITLDNAVAADRMGNQLLNAALSLATFPERGRIVPEFRRPELRETVFRSYRIIYRLNSSDDSVEIVRFWARRARVSSDSKKPVKPPLQKTKAFASRRPTKSRRRRRIPLTLERGTRRRLRAWMKKRARKRSP